MFTLFLNDILRNIIPLLYYFSELKFFAINFNFLKIKNTMIGDMICISSLQKPTLTTVLSPVQCASDV
ncbi:hypothetical protein BpHYR1_013254 [Brachionus plicatilis]|uniref:Uncharacterized protein n=1 Tax=Brachionus plicatilis TaxID=10195 RepID=A0A3M7S1G4_BRAPC|nr:hypothetical protein BpHYR1_013254 [Brachionus plicatilis]